MSTTIKLKKSSTAGDTPSASDLEVGEIAVNTADGKLFTKHGTSVVTLNNSTNEISTYINRSYIDKFDASNLPVGWYTIAQNTGSRAAARFALWDQNSGDHQSVIFYAAHHYGTDASNTITVLHNSHFSGSPFRYLRIKDGGTYDGAALQVYIDTADEDNEVRVAIVGDNIQVGGWVLVDFLADSSAPSLVSNWSSFTEKAKIDLDLIAQGGMATTGPIYADGNTTQYKVLTTNDEGTGNGIDADTVDGNHASDFATAAQGSLADSALQNVVDDTTPELGGNLDLNSNNITGTGNINITGTLETSSNATIGGNLTVSGTTTTVNTETINLADNNIVLNSNLGSSTAPSENGGITINRGSATNKVFQWDEGSDYWEIDDDFIAEGIVRANSTSNSAYTDLKYYGVEFNRVSSYVRPDSDGTKDLYIGLNTVDKAWRDIVLDADRAIVINANASEAARFDSSGRLGIANTSPSEKLDVTGNIAVSGTVDGRDVAADGTKLDGIEANATADQTKADIDALGINADQVDGIEAASFLRSDATDTATGALTFGNTVTLNGSQTGGYPVIRLTSGSSSYPRLEFGTSADLDEGIIAYTPSSNTMAFTAGTNNVLNLTDTTIEANKDITLPDNEYIKFGASDDLVIGHLSTYNANTIDAIGSIAMSTDNSILLKKGNLFGENLANFNVDGSVDLYYDNSKKFETESGGVLVTGNVRFGGSDHGQLNFVSGSNPPVFSPQFADHIVIKNVASATEQELYLLDTGDGNDGDIFGIASNNAPVFGITGNSAIKLMHPNTSSYDVTIEPTTPTSNRTLTLPNATGGVEVLKKTDFNLTPGASSVTLSISDVVTSGTPLQNRIAFCMDTMTPSSGPNNPILLIAGTSGSVTWSGSYAYTTGVDGSINGTDLLAGLTNYNYPFDGWTVEFIRTNGNTWIVKVQAGLGSSGTYFATCKASAYLTGITIQTGSSYTWSAIKGSLYEYY